MAMVLVSDSGGGGSILYSQRRTIQKKIDDADSIIECLDDADGKLDSLSKALKNVVGWNENGSSYGGYMNKIVIHKKPIDGGAFSTHKSEVDTAKESLSTLKSEVEKARKKLEEELADINAKIAAYEASKALVKNTSNGNKTTTTSTSTTASSTKDPTKKQNQNTPQKYNRGSCFLAGTKVITQNGYANIETIEIGDIVLSYNEKTLKQEYKKVINVFHHLNKIDTLYKLKIDNEIINTTVNHRFYIRRNETNKWIDAGHLKIGDEVLFIDYTYHKISSIEFLKYQDNYYNLEIEDNHNYYIGEKGILVHNKKVIM